MGKKKKCNSGKIVQTGCINTEATGLHFEKAATKHALADV